LLLYVVAYQIVRSAGADALIAATLWAALQFFFDKKMRFSRSLKLYYIFSIIILCLSIANVMPKSWTYYHQNFAAIRQWSWLPIFTVSATSFYNLYNRYWNFIQRHALFLAAIAWMISRATRALVLGSLNIQTEVLIYTLTNENAVIFALVTIHALKLRRINGLFCIGLLAAACSSGTSVVSALALIPILFINKNHYKLYIGGLCAALFCFVCVAGQFAPQLYRFDQNSGFRAVLWHDAELALTDTHGIGVGYGTEYIKNDFGWASGGIEHVREEDAPDLIYIGTHSTVFDISMRTGVLGFLLFVFGFCKEIQGDPVDPRYARLKASMLVIFILSNAVNMGVASINFTIGSAFLAALAVFARDKGR
jgi:hypothetical protein